MASDPMNFLVLYGMGIREFSMPAPFIPRIKAFLRDLDSTIAVKAAREVLTLSESAKIRAYLVEVLKAIVQVD